MGSRPALIAALLAVTAVHAWAAKPQTVLQPAQSAASKLHPSKLAPPKSARVLDLDWKELLPQAQRAHFSAIAPAPVHDYRGEGGPPAVQTPDFNVNKALEGATVRLPGFIVPLEAIKHRSVSEFLLVPYFGSCIHVPPPPPNQLVYVRTGRATTIESIYDAYWITGKLHLQTKTTRLGASAYELSADKIEVYRY